jgi:RimJ/RimL family protein N-acetyltransferase/acyl carrier protein
VPSNALASRNVRLRAVRSGDHDWLYELLAVDTGSRWRYRGRTPNPAEFHQDLWHGVHAQFVVLDREDRPVGLVGAYNFNNVAGHCHVFAVGAQDSGSVVAEASGLLINWLFDEFDVHKLWIEAPEFNLQQFANLIDVADIEGRLTNFDYWRGRYWDVLILSVNRRRWDERYRGVVEQRQRSLSDARVHAAVPSVEAINERLAALAPLDSLAAIELVSWLEDEMECELDVGLLEGLTGLAPDDVAAQIRTRLSDHPGSAHQQPSGNDGRAVAAGHEPSSDAVTLTSSTATASMFTTLQSS